jgi:peptide/nickel transport system substrate-binding protein
VSHSESNQRAVLRVPKRTQVRAFVCAILAFGLSLATATNKVWAEQSYAIAMHGAPALPADFTHMPYANPDAPKGGRLVQGILRHLRQSQPPDRQGSCGAANQRDS